MSDTHRLSNAVPPAPTLLTGNRPLFRGLARHQILVTLLIALVGGILVGGIELALDWGNLRQRIDANAQQSLNLVQDSAAAAAFHINTEQATSVARGLLHDPGIVRVTLRENFGSVLVDQSGPAHNGSDGGLLRQWLSGTTDYTRPLIYRESNGSSHEVGTLVIRIDSSAAAVDFAELAQTKLLLRVLSALLFSIVLVLVFYRMVIHPLTTMARLVNQIDASHPASMPIPIPARHQDDEFGELARTMNSLAQDFQRSLDERAAAEQQLAQMNQELERRVESRTAELRHTLEELEVKKEAAEQAARTKADFLATVSHELRTPMNGVLGCVDLLAMGNLDEEQKEFVGIIRNSGNHLLALINDILDFSKMENGKLEFAIAPVHLAETVLQVCAMVGSRASEKGLILEAESIPGELSVRGDAMRIRQVLTNLIGNAIKFTTQGEVRINVVDLSNTLRIEVTDTGIGIAPEHQDKLFMAFTQVDASTTRRYGGTGLGLAICKRLIEGMGGTIGLRSASGQGSTFWFELPRA